MGAPDNNEEKGEASNWNNPPLSDYNQPQFPPNLYDTPIRQTSHHIRPIQPFRRYNYLDAQGEDLGSRQYTLGPDNIWEVNATLTNGYRQSAQNASRLPQFTGVFAPSDTLSLPPAATTYNTTTNNLPPPSPVPQALELSPPIVSGSDIMVEMLPPSPNGSRSSPETPVTPVTPGPEPGAMRRRRPSSGKKVWSCEPCNKPFYRKAEYDRHLKTATVHQQARRFQCQYCGDGFTRADAKVRHERMCPSNPDGSGSPKGKGKGRGSSSD